MHKLFCSRLVPPCLGVFIAATGGCAASASNLKIGSVPPEDGAFFGRIAVSNEGEPVTKSCYAQFTDEGEKQKAYVSLDESGWVFGTARRGPTYVSGVICTLGGLIKYNAQYRTRKVRFELRGGDELAYFGDVQIELNSAGSGVVAGTLLGGAVGAALASAGEGDDGQLKVDVRLDEAAAEYRKRYGAQSSVLVPRVARTPEPSASKAARAERTSAPEKAPSPPADPAATGAATASD